MVNKYGIIGVAIGTIVAMTIRTIEFVYYSNKYILNRNPWNSFKKILFAVCESLIIVIICNYIPYFNNINYINLFVNSLITLIIAIIITIGFNFILFKKDLSYLIEIFKGFTKKRKKQKEMS